MRRARCAPSRAHAASCACSRRRKGRGCGGGRRGRRPCCSTGLGKVLAHVHFQLRKSVFFYPPEAVLQHDHLRRRTPMCLEPGRTSRRASAIVASPTRSRRYCCTVTASCWVFLHMHSEETDTGHRGGVSWSLPWAPPHQPAATSRRVCVVVVYSRRSRGRQEREEGRVAS